MRRHDCWESVSMVFASYQWKRRYKSAGRNICNNTGAKIGIKSEEKKVTTTCSQNHITIFRPLFENSRFSYHRRILIGCAVFMTITAMVTFVIGGNRIMVNPRSIITRYNIHRPQLPFHNAGPFVATASTIPSTVSRLHRHLVGCKCYSKFFCPTNFCYGENLENKSVFCSTDTWLNRDSQK